MSVTDKDLGYDRILAALGDMGDDEPFVLVGIRQSEGSSTVAGSDLTLATIAAINEFGTDKIPSRPFLRSTVDTNRDEYAEDIADAFKAVLDGKAPLEAGLNKLGLKAVRDVQRTIKSNDFARNAPSTIAAKGSTSPLIDTGRLRQSIDYEIGGGN